MQLLDFFFQAWVFKDIVCLLLSSLSASRTETSLWAAVLNRGKKSVSLNLKTKIGKEILLKLIQEADVLVENFRPGVMEKLKLGWKTIKKANNKLVMARISGYGQNNSTIARQAFDATIQAETGFMQISGEEKKPTMIGTVLL